MSFRSVGIQSCIFCPSTLLCWQSVACLGFHKEGISLRSSIALSFPLTFRGPLNIKLESVEERCKLPQRSLGWNPS